MSARAGRGTEQLDGNADRVVAHPFPCRRRIRAYSAHRLEVVDRMGARGTGPTGSSKIMKIATHVGDRRRDVRRGLQREHGVSRGSVFREVQMIGSSRWTKSDLSSRLFFRGIREFTGSVREDRATIRD
jgi:AraC-like DNA-binding protein